MHASASPSARPFGRLLVATGITNIGDGIRLVALPLLATRLTTDPALITGVVVADRLPWLLFLLPGGALADRFDRVRIRVRLDWFRAAIAAALAGFVLAGETTLLVLYVATIAMSAAEAIVDSSSMAMVPSMVDADELEAGLARLSATEIIGRELSGPVVGGALFAATTGLPFAVDAISFAASAAIIAAISPASLTTAVATAPAAPPVPVGVRAATTEMRRSIAHGMAWLWRQPALRALALLTTALSVAAFALISVMVIFATDELGLSAAGFGLLMIPTAFGGLLGTWIAPRLRQLPLAAVVGGAVMITGVADVLIARSSSVGLVAALLILDTGGVLVWNVLTVAYRQRLIPDEVRGRVGASFRFLLALGAPLGALVAGAATRAGGARPTILAAGITTTALGLLAIPVLARHTHRKEIAMRGRTFA